MTGGRILEILMDKPVPEPDDDSSVDKLRQTWTQRNTARARALAKQKRIAAIILAIGIAIILVSLVIGLVRE
jgi:hypothetical protein